MHGTLSFRGQSVLNSLSLNISVKIAMCTFLVGLVLKYYNTIMPQFKLVGQLHEFIIHFAPLVVNCLVLSLQQSSMLYCNLTPWDGTVFLLVVAMRPDLLEAYFLFEML